MANLGILLGTSPQHLILRTQEWDETKGIPNIGDTVYTMEKKPVGQIFDIFGPVSKPFISVQLRRNTGVSLESFKDKRGISFYTLPGKLNIKSTKGRSAHRRAPRKFPRSS